MAVGQGQNTPHLFVCLFAATVETNEYRRRDWGSLYPRSQCRMLALIYRKLLPRVVTDTAFSGIGGPNESVDKRPLGEPEDESQDRE